MIRPYRYRLYLESFGLWFLGALLLFFLVTPLLALLFNLSWAEFYRSLFNPLIGPALRVSLISACVSTCLVVLLGTPLAFMLARHPSRINSILLQILQLPVVMPPAVSGIALLLAFGRRGILVKWHLLSIDNALSFTPVAVVMAQIFVAAPLYLQSAVQAFLRLDESCILVARSLGASPWYVFFNVAIPLSRVSLYASAMLALTRALGEFGATLMFAGNLQGVTQTLPLAIYMAFESDIRIAQALAIILVLLALLLLVSVRVWSFVIYRRTHA